MFQSSSGPQSTGVPQPTGGSGLGPFTLIWVAIGAIFALLVGAGAGILDWLGEGNIPMAILYGGLAFGGTLTLVIALIRLFSR
jgi:hypothetical protein